MIHYIENEGRKEISFNSDDSWYQKVWFEDRKLGEKPELSLGFIDEDIEALKKIVRGEAEPNSVDIQRFGALFTQIGATIHKP